MSKPSRTLIQSLGSSVAALSLAAALGACGGSSLQTKKAASAAQTVKEVTKPKLTPEEQAKKDAETAQQDYDTCVEKAKQTPGQPVECTVLGKETTVQFNGQVKNATVMVRANTTFGLNGGMNPQPCVPGVSPNTLKCDAAMVSFTRLSDSTPAVAEEVLAHPINNDSLNLICEGDRPAISTCSKPEPNRGSKPKQGGKRTVAYELAHQMTIQLPTAGGQGMEEHTVIADAEACVDTQSRQVIPEALTVSCQNSAAAPTKSKNVAAR